MEKRNNKVVLDNKKFQEVLKRAEKLKSLSEDPTIAFAQGVQRAANNLMTKAMAGAKKIDALVQKAEARKLHAGSKKISKLGNLVGKIGQIAGRPTPEKAAQVLDDGAKPIVKQILVTAKGVIDAMEKASKDAVDGMCRVHQTSIDGARKLNEQTKSIVIERTTSMATKVKTFARETYGGFLSPDKLDEITSEPIKKLLGGMEGVLERIDKEIPDETSDQEFIENNERFIETMRQQGVESRAQAFDAAINEACELVGDEVAKEVAVEVFGFDVAEEMFARRPRKRSLVGGLVEMAKTTITTSGQIGGDAIDTAAGLVKSMAVGQDGQSGLMGENGIGATLKNTAGDVAGTMLNTATDIASSIFGKKGDESKGAMDIAKDVANSMIDCVGGVGGSLIDGIGDVAKGAAGIAGDMAKGLADFAGNAWDAGVDMASGLYDSVKDMLGLSDEEVQDTVEDVAEAADEMMDEMEDDLDDLFDDEEEDLDDLFAEEEEMEDEWDEEAWDEDWEDWEDDEDWEDEDWEDDEWDWEDDEDEGEDEDDDEESKPNDAESTTPMGNDSPSQSNGLVASGNVTPSIGWRGIDPDIKQGLVGMMHDGDQQLFNPYGPETGAWTMYSFRPSDAEKCWPQIAITPSSFEAIKSMRKMLNHVPYVVVKEYFFKNTASTMIDFVKKIAGMVKDAKESPKDDGASETGAKEESSQGEADAKSTGNTFMDKVKSIFHKIPLKKMVIDIPYILYFCLRQKQYGNTYIFPYIVQSGSTVINEASNASEWGKDEGIFGVIKDFVAKGTEMVGGLAVAASGSQAKVANLFPAPSWKGPNGQEAQFQFDLILINDNVVKARNNYMCVNTIIHNNRSIQKAILNFPGALYEVWLPTGQRHLMCTGDFKLYPIGLNRMTPDDFFKGSSSGSGANVRIGTDIRDVSDIQNPEKLGHIENMEVVPDAYKLSITFKSCIANNMNTAVFQYYVKMTGYDYDYEDDKDKKPEETNFKDNAFGPGGVSENPGVQILKEFAGNVGQVTDANNGGEAGGGEEDKSLQKVRLAATATRSAKSIVDMRMGDILNSADFQEISEKFSEATYNKRLGKLRTEVGDQATNSDSAVATIRKAQTTVKETSGFLAKLYNAPENNLWYREDPKEELYTTLKPDYRKMLRNKYQAKMRELRSVDSQLKSEGRKLSNVESQLSNQFNLEKREELLETKVMLTRSMNALEAKKGDIADELIQIDTDIIQSAFDEQDDVVSVRKTDVGFRIFQQVWNEKIMNSYEKDKLQYLTSQEKERYFKEKLRELEKFDVHGVLKKPDWFFRVVVLDYIVGEMKRLILWFKDCSWDDFETVYKITRKLRMLQLDVDAAHSDKPFDINHTNLFQVTDEDVKDYTKIDKMLVGNTLYELFSSIVRTKVVKPLESDSDDDGSDEREEEDREVVMDRKSEIETSQQRNVRYDVVVRYWGSEAALTKQAYDIVNQGVDDPIEVPDFPEIRTLGQLKSRIIELKLENQESEELHKLLAALVNQVSTVKEALVIEKMNEMKSLAREEIEKKDDSVMADVVS